MPKQYLVPQYLAKGVVLFQPGLWCTEDTFKEMWNVLPNYIEDTDISLAQEILTADNVGNFDVKNAIIRECNLGKITFFRTLFRSGNGRVDDQVEELHTIITAVEQYFRNVPIILVGYSKGGLVNMRYVTIHKNKIHKLISIGTPYENGVIQRLQSLGETVSLFMDCLPSTPIVNGALYGFNQFLQTHNPDTELGSEELYSRVRYSWNNLSDSERPPLVCIGCSQFGTSSDVENGSDLLVPVQTQKALNYSGVYKRITITNDCYTVFNEVDLFAMLYNLSPANKIERLYDATMGVSNYYAHNDPLFIVVGIIFAAIPLNIYSGDYSLIHTQEIRNENVCKCVLSNILSEFDEPIQYS